MNSNPADEVYTIGKATVRIHGKADPDKVRAATERYVKRMSKEERENELECARTEP